MRRITTAVAFAIALAACSGGTSVTEQLFGQWEVSGIADDSGAVQPTIEETFLTATITDDDVSGTAGCNGYGGAATVNGSDVSFGPFASTLMACMEPVGVMAQEQEYLTMLQAVDTWEGTEEGVDLNVDGAAAIKLVPLDTDLVGTSWNVTAVNNQTGGVQSVVAGSDPTLVFDDESVVTGTTGCNNFFGEYATDGESIEFSQLAMTEIFCEDTADQEVWMLAALEGATTYRTDSQSLELFDAEGSRLLTAGR